MKKTIAFLSILAVLSLGSALASAPQIPEKPPGFSPDEQKQLDRGLPVKKAETFDLPDGNRAGRGVVYIKIKAAPDQIFKQILDYDHYKEFYPHVAGSALYKKEGDVYFVRFTLSLAKVVKITYHCKHDYNPSNASLTWMLDPDKKNDFNQTIGFWKAWPLSEKESLLAYSVYVDSGQKVPGFLEEMATGYGLKKVASCMKKRVESGGTYTGED